MRVLPLLLFAALLIACTDSEPQAGVEINAGIGNDCGPADAREVWLRVAADSTIARCPSATLDGIRIRVLEGLPLDSLKAGTYTDLPARNCRDTVIYCPALTATVQVQKVTPTEVIGRYRLFDSTATSDAWESFRAQRCIITPLCG